MTCVAFLDVKTGGVWLTSSVFCFAVFAISDNARLRDWIGTISKFAQGRIRLECQFIDIWRKFMITVVDLIISNFLASVSGHATHG